METHHSYVTRACRMSRWGWTKADPQVIPTFITGPKARVTNRVTFVRNAGLWPAGHSYFRHRAEGPGYDDIAVI
jgi:hypothetical protein